MITRLRQLFSRKFVQDTLILQVGKIGMVALSLLSSVLVWRLMGPQEYGIYVLAQSFLVIWMTLDFTGLGMSTSTRLAIAIGKRDESLILDYLAFHVQVSLAVRVLMVVMIALVGGAATALLYGNSQIGVLAMWLAVGGVADALYGLVIISLQTRRLMRSLVLLQNVNQFTLTALLITAVLISPTPESLIAARVIYSFATMLFALYFYQRRRTGGQVSYPPLRAIFARARTVSPRPYWRFGVANAIDKNISELFLQIPVQLVGVFSGARAVGYLTLAVSGITQASILTSAVFENMQAVVPQLVGRGDYKTLRRNFGRVLLVMALGGVLFYGAVALVAPLIIPPILGAKWLPAVPPLVVLTIYGAVSAVGGNFGPLYRAFGQMRESIVAKLVALVLVLPVGIILLQRVAAGHAFTGWLGVELIPPDLSGAGVSALVGALMIDALFVISVALSALITLPELKKRADDAERTTP